MDNVSQLRKRLSLIVGFCLGIAAISLTCSSFAAPKSTGSSSGKSKSDQCSDLYIKLMSQCTNSHPDWSWSDCNQAATRSYNNCMAAAGLQPGNPPRIPVNTHPINGVTNVSAGSATPARPKRPGVDASVAPINAASPSPTATPTPHKKETRKHG